MILETKGAFNNNLSVCIYVFLGKYGISHNETDKLFLNTGLVATGSRHNRRTNKP